MAASDYFLKVDGVKGEATDEKHKEEIDIESFSFGAEQKTGAVGGGHGAGKVQIRDVSFTAKVNKSSPILFLKCATGEHIKEATLVCRRAGGKQEEYFTAKFNDIFVSSYQVGGQDSADAIPTDQFSLNFAKIELEYKPQDAKGALGTPSKAGYDLKLQKKL